jgi:hypothetical protein
MRVLIKYFYDESEPSNRMWESNLYRIIFLHDHLSEEEQLVNLQNNITRSKQILALRFTSVHFLKTNPWFNRILLGRGIPYENTTWKPKEVWIHGPIE